MAKILDFPPKNYPIKNVTFIDYEPSENCCNADSFNMICVKCEGCGRKFIDGVLEEGGE